MTTSIIVGDCLDVLRDMDAESVQCVVTSPPYWGLRTYLDDDHADKGLELGLEPTLDEFIAKLVAVFREVRRVLRKDGVCWVNLGDTYAGGKCGGGSPVDERKPEYGRKGFVSDKVRGRKEGTTAISTIPAGFKPKDLCGVPWRVALALQADGWWLRSDVIWAKPNPMPESCTDRPTKAHEYMFLLTRSAHYYYDAEAVREALALSSTERLAQPNLVGQVGSDRAHAGGKTNGPMKAVGCQGGRNLRSVWTVDPTAHDLWPMYLATFQEMMQQDGAMADVWKLSTQSFKKAHFATFPQKLVEPCLKAGTSAKGCCPECGKPWVRVVDKKRKATRPGNDNKQDESGMANRDSGRHVTESTTVGWEEGCVCHWKKFDEEYGEPIRLTPIPCTVLDPFAGSGIVGVVCKQMGLDFIGIELNPEYAEMARKRIANPKPEPEIPDVEGQLQLFEEKA